MTAELASATPRLAIVIPIYRHSALVIEAIESVLAQRFDGGLHLVLVSDGCPMPETDQVCREYGQAYPELVSYLRKRNGGLSDARNFGIRHVLKRFPTVEAIYMLDADNRLRRDAMARAMAVLDADPEVDWVYPNIDMFGLEQYWDFGGEYSTLINTEMNICEAGSLIKRSVFEAGIFFDTSFKMGWEDWDFFLSAARAGFRGKNLEHFGFLYRKRPESMLAESSRSESVLAGEMERKHKNVLKPKHMLQAEHEEAPRFAVHIADRGKIVSGVDLAADTLITQSVDEFEDKYWKSVVSSGRNSSPSINIIISQYVLDALKASGMLSWALWKLETILEHQPLASLIVSHGSADRLSITEHKSAGQAGLHRKSVVMAISARLLRDVVMDSKSEWIDTLAHPTCHIPITALEIKLPPSSSYFPMVQRPTAVFDLLTLVHRLRTSRWRDAAGHKWGFRQNGIPWRNVERDIVRKRTVKAPVFPKVPDGRKHIGFILPLVEFGGVEKVALQMARALRAYGWIPHAFVLEASDISFSSDWASVFESTNLLASPDFRAWGAAQQSYLGTDVPIWAQNGNHGQLLGMLCWLDAAINFHGGAAVGVMGQLRRMGVTTLNSLHLNDLSPLGRPVGNTFLGMAYEHAFDYFVPCSHQLGHWLHGMGIPQSKIIPAPNAAGFELSAESIDRCLVAKSKRSKQTPLRALYLGRLDRQKGLDRLTEVIRRSIEEKLHIEWRVVGKAVLAGGDRPLAPEILRHLEPAVTTPAQLRELYDWADVVVLLSNYEGLPLTIIEAMRQGVIPIATDVGAVREVVRDASNGILLTPETSVDDCVAALNSLAKDREMLRTLSEQAADEQRDNNWVHVTKKLAEQIDSLGKGQMDG